MKKLLMIILSTLLIFFVMPLSTVTAQPPNSHLFYGNVTLDGAPAPSGTSITATMSGYPDFSTTTTGSYYELTVNGTTADIGKTVDLYVNGIYADSSTFAFLGVTQLDLLATTPPPQYTLTMAVNGVGTTNPSVGNHIYEKDRVVNISATPGEGWRFDNWTGDVADPDSASTTVKMDGNKTVTANFSQFQTYTLTMAVSGNGTTEPPVGNNIYIASEVVNIIAIPDEGWQFVSWTGDVADPNAASTTVTMDDDKTVTANFSPVGVTTFTLTMAVSGNGTTSPSAGEHTYPEGTVVDITAIPGEGWQFVSWTGSVANPDAASTTVTMDKNKTVTANFSPVGVTTYTLTMAVNGNGTTSPSAGEHSYAEGTVVDITATPDEGWQFNNWTGDVANPNSASTTVTMDKNKTVTANFSQVGVTTYTLTIGVSGNGTTDPPAGEYIYAEGTVVAITATPDEGWQFDSWTGEVANPNAASTTVTMDKNKTVTANFSQGEDITAPIISNISTFNITKTSAKIIWITDEPGDSQVEYWSSPSELTPLDETLVTEHLVHLTGLTPATTYYYKVMSRDGAGNLAVSDEYTFTTSGSPANFVTGNWDIDQTELDTGKEVTISFLVTNTGDLAGNYQAIFKVNGLVEATKEVTLDAGASEEITFTTTKNDEGTYFVTVDGLTLSFTVKLIPTKTETNWWLIIGIIAGLTLLIISIILFVKRERLKERFTFGGLFARRDWLKAGQGFRPEVRDETKIKAMVKEAKRLAKERAKREVIEAKEARKVEERTRKGVERLASESVRREFEEAKIGAFGGVAEERAHKEAKEVKEGIGGLTVTETALEKLKEAIQAKTTEPEVGYRIVPSTSRPNQLKMILDKEKEGDQVVESEGVKVLFLNSKLTPMLEGMVIDYQEAPQGGGFTISKLSPDT